MMTSLTRDEFITYLYHIETAAYTQAYKEKMIDHDQAQRVVIERQAKEIEQWKTAAQQQNGWYEPLQRENKTLREALQLLYDCQNGCPLPKYEADWNRAMELAQQALKEVS